jgi:Flp pilus assembly protein CpaB
MAKSPKPFRPVVVTANDLRSGAVVYRRKEGAWTSNIASADIAGTAEAADALLAAAKADHDACRVVEPMLIEIAAGQPASLRERIRSLGPTAGSPPPARA